MGCLSSAPSNESDEKDDQVGELTAQPKVVKRVQLSDNVSAKTSTRDLQRAAVEEEKGNKSPKVTAQRTTKNKITKYLMRFGKINDAYMKLYKTIGYDCTGLKEQPLKSFDKTKSRDDVAAGLQKLGVIISPEYLVEMFDEDPVTFRKVVVKLNLLVKDQGSKEPKFTLTMPEDKAGADNLETIQKGFQTVIDMFRVIDEDDSGEISEQEFKDAFVGLGLGDATLYDKRLAELDFNGDRNIDHGEFCEGISIWIGFLDDLAELDTAEG